MGGDLFGSTQSATKTSSIFALFCAIAIYPALVKGEEYEEGEQGPDDLDQDLPHMYDQSHIRKWNIIGLVFAIYFLVGHTLAACYVFYTKFCTKPETPNCLFLLHNRLGICKSCQGMEDLITIGIPEPEVPRSPEPVVADLRSEERQPCPCARSERLFYNPNVESNGHKNNQFTSVEIDEVDERMVDRRRHQLPPLPPKALAALKQSRRQSI